MSTHLLEQQKSLLSFLADHDDIQFAVPESKNFGLFKDRSAVYNPAIPLAIYVHKTRLPFVVRSGGNNLCCQLMVRDTVTLDMRDISHCLIDKTKRSARIGGGILMGNLIDRLGQEGLSTATGMVPWVGYTGWSVYGGYGPLSGSFGLGFERIIAAKVVNYKGEVIEAGDDLLRGIKGAGGCFGVIAEMTIKTYPLQQLLSGNIIFNSTNSRSTIGDIFRGVEKLRTEGSFGELCVAPLFMNTPNGISISCHVMWSGKDEALGARYVDQVSKFSQVKANNVRRTTHAGATEDFGQDFAPKEGAYGSVNTLSIRHFTEQVIQVIEKHVQVMPAQFGTGFAVHVAPESFPESRQGSVFAALEPHYMLEFLHCAPSKEAVEESTEWSSRFLAEMQQTDSANILQSTYINLTPPGRNTLEKVFGENFDFVKSLKENYDPEGVFNFAAPFSW